MGNTETAGLCHVREMQCERLDRASLALKVEDGATAKKCGRLWKLEEGKKRVLPWRLQEEAAFPHLDCIQLSRTR